MNRCVRPLLLLGLGLFAASGCASSAPTRANGFAQRMPWVGKESSASKSDADNRLAFERPKKHQSDSTELPAVKPGASRRELLSSVADSNNRDERQIASATEPDFQPRPLMGGHSSDFPATISERPIHGPRPTSTKLPRSNPEVIQTGHEQQAVAQSFEPLPGEEAFGSGVTTANFRSDRDTASNPVELMGFEATDSQSAPPRTGNQNEPPLWEHRPAARQVQHAVGRIDPTPKSNGRVQMVNGQSTPVVPTGPWQQELEQLVARAERDVANLKPGTTPDAQADYRRRHVHLRLLQLMAERQEQALTAIPGLNAAEQEYWQQLIWATSNSLDAEQFPSPSARAAHSITPLNSALRRLREQSDLVIKNIAFCEQISYFGNYQKFPRNEFTPGQEVLLYAEIENFNTELTADGDHRTLLRSVIDITGENGETRWHKIFPATEDRCRNVRRDYFHNYQFAIPDRLPLGPHKLKLTVVDDLSGKQASYELNFLVK